MGSVINLFDRKVQEKKTPTATPQYHCTKCEGTHFQLFDSGEVFCSSCAAKIHNVRVIDQ